LAQVTESLSVKNRLDLFFGIGLQIIGTVFLIRLMVDTGVRMMYPFIPQFSAGLGMTVVGFSWLIFVRSVAGMLGPLFGLLADRYGRRTLMAVGLLCQSIGVAGVALAEQWWAIVPMILFGLGPAAFAPAQLAYISDQVSYQKRGRALASIDVSYALTGIALMPLVGWLIELFGWRSPFLLLSLFSLLAAAFVWFRLPATERRAHASPSLAEAWQVVLKPNVVASVGVGFLVFFAAGCFVTVWAIWLGTDFELDAVSLGLVATGIGLAELGGAALSGLFIDRIGKQRGSLISILLTVGFLVLLPLVPNRLNMVVPLLIGLGGAIEFAIVSLFPLFSEQAPQARATVFSVVVLGISIGLATSSPITAVLWEQVGLWAVSAVAGGGLLVAFGLIWKVLHERAA